MKFIKDFSLLTVIPVLFLFSCNSTANITQPFSSITDYTEVIELSSGKLKGIYNEEGTVSLYAGVPYAAPPVGDLRWREPEEVEAWDDILLCDSFKPEAMQIRMQKFHRWIYNTYLKSKGSRTDNAPMSEDCLYLNIWTPAKASEEKLPVLVFYHGGSLLSGQSWFEHYDGEYLASQGIIVVTVAYRLSLFGYMATTELEEESENHTTGNYGLLDQIKALEWVNKNIEAFGGDSGNITIAGESAGSSSVNAMCASPLTKGLFRRAIAESSGIMHEYPAHTFRSKEDALKMGADIMELFNCSTIEEMRKLPADQLIAIQFENKAMTVDGYALPKTPYEIYQAEENNEEALLNGFNANEAGPFAMLTRITKSNYKKILAESPYIKDLDGLLSLRKVRSNKEASQFYCDAFSAICFTHPHDEWTKTVAAQGRPVYEYFFTKENKSFSTMHSGEMMYFYGNVPRNKVYKTSDYELETKATSYILNYVRYGDPNGKATDGTDLPEWKTYNESKQLIELGEKIYMREDPFTEFYQYIK